MTSGAGVGDHTTSFLDRGCTGLSVEPRRELPIVCSRYAGTRQIWSFQGIGCQPTRPWVFSHQKTLFPYAYATKTQPAHEEFPLDWTPPPARNGLHRAVFVASR